MTARSMKAHKHQPVLMIIECCAFFFCVGFACLWIFTPDKHFDARLALSLLTFTGTEMVRRYVRRKEPHVKVDIDMQNVYVVRYHPDPTLPSCVAIAFLGITVTNESSVPITIRDVLFRYTYRGLVRT